MCQSQSIPAATAITRLHKSLPFAPLLSKAPDKVTLLLGLWGLGTCSTTGSSHSADYVSHPPHQYITLQDLSVPDKGIQLQTEPQTATVLKHHSFLLAECRGGLPSSSLVSKDACTLYRASSAEVPCRATIVHAAMSPAPMISCQHGELQQKLTCSAVSCCCNEQAACIMYTLRKSGHALGTSVLTGPSHTSHCF